MKLLIIGGTIFLGRHLVQAALERGHEVTLFHRGKHNPGLFPEVETIIGDRMDAEDIAALAGRNWDVLIDTCGYVPRATRLTAQALGGNVRRYCFISTVSVYSDWSQELLTEESTLGTLEDPTTEAVTGDTYGPLKVLCENVVLEALGEDRTLIVRPGLIVGPHDISDRFTYWPHRVAQGGEVLAPGRPDTITQFIDVRDLSEWTIHLLEQSKTGIYNADGLPTSFGDLLAACQAAAGDTNAKITYLPESFIQEQGIAPWSELPLWIPHSEGHSAVIDVSRAISEGLTFRPLQEIVTDTLAWDQARTDTETAYRNTLTAEKEAAVLEKFKQTPV